MRPPKSPTPSILAETGESLLLRCIDCGRDRTMSPFEALYRYGHDLTFDELRAVIWSRCGATQCKAMIGPSIQTPPVRVSRR